MQNLKYIVLVGTMFFFYFWVIQYEKQTIKLEKRMESIEAQMNTMHDYIEFNDYRITYPEEYLEIPDAPKNYWE